MLIKRLVKSRNNNNSLHLTLQISKSNTCIIHVIAVTDAESVKFINYTNYLLIILVAGNVGL